MSKEEIEAITKMFVAQIPVGHQGIPDDVAKAVLFLVSEGAAYIAGSVLVVDGGYLVG
jgi:NAD(P)-dependent dehydrogenase (short-subunit alcohol dehydrogenase family)